MISLRLAVFVLLTVSFVGCASGSRLAAGSPTTPGANQTAAQMDHDITVCAEQARTAATTDGPLDMLYQACMLARGYWTVVGTGAGLFVDVSGRHQRSDEAARAELRRCLDRSRPDIGAGKIALAATFGYRMIEAEAVKARELFIACMATRDYEVRPWKPTEK